MGNVFVYVNLLAAFVLILFGSYVYFLEKEELNICFFKMCVLESFWAFFSFQTRMVCDYRHALFWLKLGAIWPLAIIMFYYFVGYLSHRKNNAYISYFIVSTGLMLMLVDYTTMYITGPMIQTSLGWSYLIQTTGVTYISILWAGFVIIYSGISMINVFCDQYQFLQKRKYGTILLGIIFYVILFSIGSGFFSCKRIFLPEMVSLAYLSKAFFVWYAMKKFDLFKIKISKDALRVFDYLADMVIITDSEGLIIYSNEKVRAVFGKSLEGDVVSRYLKKDIKASNTKYETFLLVEKKTVSVLVSTSTLLSNDNLIKGRVYIVRNITDIKEYENALILTNNELSRSNCELKKAQKKLIESEKMAGIGHLAAGLAHEINNPIGFVKSNIETLAGYVDVYNSLLLKYRFLVGMLKEKDYYYGLFSEDIENFEDVCHIEYIETDIKDLLEETLYGINRVADIVRALKDFSGDKREGHSRMYDLNKGVTSTLLIARNKIGKLIDVKVDLGELPKIRVYGSMIDQVILNLIVNGIDAIKEKYPETGGLLQIKTYYKDNYVFCEIEDNGVGMDEKTMNAIFNPFFTTKEVGKGTGLGLSIVYDIIVNKHSGDIWVESEQGKGSRFIFKLENDGSLENDVNKSKVE